MPPRWWILVLMASPLTAYAEDLTLGERRPVAMVVMSPPGVSAPLASSDLYELADQALAELGPLAIRTPEQAGIDPDQLSACGLEERLRCYARTVTQVRRGREPRYLAVISVLPVGRQRKLTSLVMDLDAALGLMSLGDEAEDRIYTEATVKAEATLKEGDRLGMSAHFKTLFTAAVPFFRSSGYDQPSARLTLLDSTGLSLELDGRALGTLVGPDTTLRELLPGPRKISFEDPERRFLPQSQVVTLAPGDDQRLELLRIADPRVGSSVHPLHQVNYWGGLGLSAIGAGLTIWAIAASPNTTRVGVCEGPGCSDRERRFANFCELTSERPADCGGGVLAAPLGISLILAGGGTAILDSWLTRPEELPWWPPLISFASGLLFYGLAAAIH